jgi:hypothetical protein
MLTNLIVALHLAEANSNLVSGHGSVVAVDCLKIMVDNLE